MTKIMSSFMLLSLSTLAFSITNEKLADLQKLRHVVAASVSGHHDPLDFTAEKKNSKDLVTKLFKQQPHPAICINNNLTNHEICLTAQDLADLKKMHASNPNSSLSKETLLALITSMQSALSDENTYPLGTKLHVDYKNYHLSAHLSSPDNHNLLSCGIDTFRTAVSKTGTAHAKATADEQTIHRLANFLHSVVA